MPAPPTPVDYSGELSRCDHIVERIEAAEGAYRRGDPQDAADDLRTARTLIDVLLRGEAV